MLVLTVVFLGLSQNYFDRAWITWYYNKYPFLYGHAPLAVALQTGHKSLTSFESYKNLTGSLSLRQHTDFNCPTSLKSHLEKRLSLQ